MPKHVVDARLMFVLINTLRLVGITDGVRWYKKNARSGEL